MKKQSHREGHLLAQGQPAVNECSLHLHLPLLSRIKRGRDF